MFTINLYKFLIEKAITYIEKLIFIVIVFIAANILSNILKRSLDKLSGSDKFNRDSIYFLKSFITFSIRVSSFIVFLNILGININNFLTFIGATGVSLSLVFKDSLESMLSGFVIIFNRTLKKGDRVKIGDIEGFIEEVHLMRITIKANNETVIIPNNYLVKNFINIKNDETRG